MCVCVFGWLRKRLMFGTLSLGFYMLPRRPDVVPVSHYEHTDYNMYSRTSKPRTLTILIGKLRTANSKKQRYGSQSPTHPTGHHRYPCF
jgi:hypothetical protein